MPSKRTNQVHRLGDLQLRIMNCLWEKGEASVNEVVKVLNVESQFAYTTIATMLRKLEARGLVAHREEGRAFIYRALARQSEVSQSLADHLVQRLFSGNWLEAVSQLISTREISRAELKQLEKLIAERKKKL